MKKRVGTSEDREIHMEERNQVNSAHSEPDWVIPSANIPGCCSVPGTGAGAGERGVSGLAGLALPGSEIQGPSVQCGGLRALEGWTHCAGTDGSKKELPPGLLGPSVVARGGYLVPVVACPLSACRSACALSSCPSQAPSESSLVAVRAGRSCRWHRAGERLMPWPQGDS